MKYYFNCLALALIILCSGCTKMIFDGWDPSVIEPVESIDGKDSGLLCSTVTDYFTDEILRNVGWAPKREIGFAGMPQIAEELDAVYAFAINSKEELGDLSPVVLADGTVVEMPEIDFGHYTLIVGTRYSGGHEVVSASRVKPMIGGIHLYLKLSPNTGIIHATNYFIHFTFLYPKLPEGAVKISCLE